MPKKNTMSLKLKTNDKKQTLNLRLRLYSWENYFVIIALIFGTIFIFLVRPLSVPDEFNHFMRAYQISEGNFSAHKDRLKGTGGDIPSGIIDLGQKQIYHNSNISNPATIKLNVYDRVFIRFDNTALYHPLLYLPQATGILIGRILGMQTLGLLYFGRFFNLLFYAALFYLVLRIAPVGKRSFFVVGLLPMHLLLASSLSADPISTSLLALFVAVFLKLRVMNKRLTNTQFVMLGLLVAAISLTKLPVPLCLLLLVLVPYTTFGQSKKTKLIAIFLFGMIGVAVGGAWLMKATSISTPFGPAGVNQANQISSIIQHPKIFIRALSDTIFRGNSSASLDQYVLALGNLEAWLPLWLTLAYTLFLGFTIKQSKASVSIFKIYEKVFITGLIITMIFIILLLLYLSWTPVGLTVINGIQARYFTPLLLLTIPIFSYNAKIRESMLINKNIILTSIFFLMISQALAYSFFILNNLSIL